MTMSHYVEWNDNVTLCGMECIIKIIVEIAGNLVIERENSVLYIAIAHIRIITSTGVTGITSPYISLFHKY